MKKILIAISIFIILASSSIAHCRELNINFHRQNTNVWCWAATIAMMVEYVTGKSIEDCEVLSEYDRSLGGFGACCHGDSRCVRTGNENEIAHILGNLFGVQGRFIPYPPSFQDIKRSIDNNHPLIATLRQQMGGGHVVVVSGYRNHNQVVVLDPMNGKYTVDYQKLMSNFQYGNWTGSFLITPENSNSHRNSRPMPRPRPQRPRIASQCVTNFLACPMGIAMPVGSPCTCFTPRGPIPGIAR